MSSALRGNSSKHAYLAGTEDLWKTVGPLWESF